jgi:small-conductance mechanosensitive channel
VGGKIYAQEGIQAAQVGSPTSPRTELICGINAFVQQKLLWIRDKNLALATRLKQVQTRMAAEPSSRARLADVHDRLRAAIHRLNESAQELMKELDKNDRAFVQVQGSVYPGSYIEICHVPFVVTENLASVRFSLDKHKGKIVVDPLL